MNSHRAGDLLNLRELLEEASQVLTLSKDLEPSPTQPPPLCEGSAIWSNADECLLASSLHSKPPRSLDAMHVKARNGKS